MPTGHEPACILCFVPDTDVGLGWSQGTVPLHTHACFYYSDETALRQTLAFLRMGLDEPGTFNVLFADEGRHAELLGWLQEGYQGSVEEALAARRLSLIPGYPTRDELLRHIAAELDRGLAGGAARIRFLGFIAWGQPGWPDEDGLLQFEAQVNDAVGAYPAVVICTYGVPRLTGRQLIEGGLATHPVVFLNNRVLDESPLYSASGVAGDG